MKSARILIAGLMIGCLVAYAQTRETFSVGASANDGTGDSLRSFAQKVSNNESNLFKLVLTNSSILDALFVVEDVAALVALDPANKANVRTLGYYAPGDGGGATYRWTNALPSGVSTNSGTWFAGASGYWTPLDELELSPRLIGSVGLSSAVIVGDSITRGASASGYSTRWHQLVANRAKWSGDQIGAWGGARIEDIAWQVMPGMSVTNADYYPSTVYVSASPTTNAVLLALVGYNDQRGGGTDPTRRSHFGKTLRHIAAWWAAPSKKLAQNADAESGSWSDLSFYGGSIGRTSSTPGDSITFSNVVGDAVYIGFQANTTGTSSISVSVDGVSKGTYLAGPTFFNAAAFAPSYVGPNGDGTFDENPWCERIGGLGMSAHTVTVTVVSVSGGAVSVLWAGGNGQAKALSGGPMAMIGNTIRSTVAGYSSGSDAGVALYNWTVRRVIGQLQGDGLRVMAVDAASVFDPSTGMSVDNVHPNDTGHAQIADAFIEAISRGYDRVKAAENRSPINDVWKTGDTSATLRVPNSVNTGDRLFSWQGGELPFRSAQFYTPSISGSFDSLQGTSGHSSGTVRFWDAEHGLQETGTAGSVGLSFRTYVTSAGSGSHYPALFATTQGSTNWNNFRLDLFGDALVEGLADSGGRVWYFRDPTLTGSQVYIKYADSTLARRLVLSGNSVVAYDTNGVAANLAIGASGVSTAIQGSASVAQTFGVTGKSTLSGGLAVGYTAVTTNTTLTSANVSINVNDTSGNVAITLPSAVGISGQWFLVKKTGGSNTTTILAADSGSDHVLGLGESILIESNGAAWHIKAGYKSSGSTKTLTPSGGTATLNVGGRTIYNHYLDGSTSGSVSLVWSGLADGDSGVIYVNPATTNITLTVPSYAFTPTGSTLTVSGGTGSTNYTNVAWQAQAIGGTNRVTANASNYYR